MSKTSIASEELHNVTATQRDKEPGHPTCEVPAFIYFFLTDLVIFILKNLCVAR